MRDENGFKCHTQSESHVRQMLLVGEDSRKHIADYSNQFQRDFLQLLRTSHGEKKININHFYQEYISNKEHVHMNSTRWPSLTEFAKWLGREGICRVEEGDKGLEVAWIDNSPEALRRQDAIRKKERQDKGDEEREQRLLQEQIERARKIAEEKERAALSEDASLLDRKEGEKIKLNFGKRELGANQPSPATDASTKNEKEGDAVCITEISLEPPISPENTSASASETPPPVKQPEKASLKLSVNNKPKNVFAVTAKKNAFGGPKATPREMPKKPMSEAERNMREENERKRSREVNGFSGLNTKRQKVA